ncbi:hypothetical protein HPB51_025377 [Rhipicephalus microplus]|uniref:Uncharacterized protein n=1 Tax=Rhipicephalus microplus TaxID=6941 RepID=A0A9J6DE20_RHIMP|nr:hypothetical protein HPB51_025377 [Rhipicephalus microplus]
MMKREQLLAEEPAVFAAQFSDNGELRKRRCTQSSVNEAMTETRSQSPTPTCCQADGVESGGRVVWPLVFGSCVFAAGSRGVSAGSPHVVSRRDGVGFLATRSFDNGPVRSRKVRVRSPQSRALWAAAALQCALSTPFAGRTSISSCSYGAKISSSLEFSDPELSHEEVGRRRVPLLLINIEGSEAQAFYRSAGHAELCTPLSHCKLRFAAKFAPSQRLLGEQRRLWCGCVNVIRRIRSLLGSLLRVTSQSGEDTGRRLNSVSGLINACLALMSADALPIQSETFSDAEKPSQILASSRRAQWGVHSPLSVVRTVLLGALNGARLFASLSSVREVRGRREERTRALSSVCDTRVETRPLCVPGCRWNRLAGSSRPDWFPPPTAPNKACRRGACHSCPASAPPPARRRPAAAGFSACLGVSRFYTARFPPALVSRVERVLAPARAASEAAAACWAPSVSEALRLCSIIELVGARCGKPRRDDLVLPGTNSRRLLVDAAAPLGRLRQRRTSSAHSDARAVVPLVV